MVQRRQASSATSDTRTTAVTILVIVLTAFVLGLWSLHGGEAGAIATRIIAGIVAVALLVRAGACALQGWRMLRSGTTMVALLWWLGAIVQSLLALLSLTHAFPIS